MKLLILAIIGCGLVSAGDSEPTADADFVTQPQDTWARPGDTVQLDCELTEASQSDICAWRISGTHLGVDHFYNVEPPAKVQPLFPEHERVCSLLIQDVDWRHDGYWTCWPLAAQSHTSSRAARLTVADDITTQAPTSTARTTTLEPTTETTTLKPTTTRLTTNAPTTNSDETTTERRSTTPEPATTTSAAPPTATTTPPVTTTVAPSTTSEAPVTTASPTPTPSFVCPQPNGLFADPDSSRYYYYCRDGVAIHMQCESPQHWNNIQKECL